MKKSITTRGRLAYWLIPVAILACSVAFQACGDDDESCGDSEVLPSVEACEDYAAEFDCADFSYNDATDICTVSGCACAFIIDDIDDF
jgi:hypothetical protein